MYLNTNNNIILISLQFAIQKDNELFISLLQNYLQKIVFLENTVSELAEK